jgi:hypothetical protein
VVLLLGADADDDDDDDDEELVLLFIAVGADPRVVGIVKSSCSHHNRSSPSDLIVIDSVRSI